MRPALPGTARLAVGLYRVSTAEQGQSGLGLEAQQASVRAFAIAQGWNLVAEYSDIASGKDDGRPGFQAALTRCRQLGAVLVAARLDRITRRAHTLSGLLEEGYQIRAADMPGADDLMMRNYAAMAQKERELISERTRAALAAAKARGALLGGDQGYRPPEGPSAAAAAQARRSAAERAAHRLALEVERLRADGVTGQAAIARVLTERGVPTPRGSGAWTHTTVARVLAGGGCIGQHPMVRISSALRPSWSSAIQDCLPQSGHIPLRAHLAKRVGNRASIRSLPTSYLVAAVRLCSAPIPPEWPEPMVPSKRHASVRVLDISLTKTTGRTGD